MISISKKITLLISLTYFFILLSYPLVRSASGALFYEHYTSEQYSFATFIGVVALMGLISLSNKLQGKIGVQNLFLGTSFLSIGLLGGSFLALESGIKEAAYLLFATKESYIVLLVHSCLAYANAYYDLINLKKYIGPIGAIGSIGGIIGGQLTSFLASSEGTNFVLIFSFVFILISGICFYLTKSEPVKGLAMGQSITPLKAVRGVKKYILLIGAIVALSQCVIYMADLQFNMAFEKMVTTKDARASYLGDFYSIINVVALFMQFIILPFLLTRFPLKNIFIFVPAFYLVMIIAGAGYGAHSLGLIAGIFIAMKGTDYSLFAATKDVMYHPLLSLQKYGAKYITDMFVYRTSKALIAFIMAQFVNIHVGLMTTLQFFFLTAWIFAVIYLFEEQKKLNRE